MPILPLTPYVKRYRGSKENLRRKNAEQIAAAYRVADHVNRSIANNPSEIQQYSFFLIARDVGVTEDQVRSAISDGGYNGITVRVTEEDRVALAAYKS